MKLYLNFRFLYLFSFIIFNGIIKVSSAQNCSINAGVSTEICKKDTMYLNGSRSGLLNSNSISNWTQMSGPSVFIQSPNALTSGVTGFEAGLYKFKLSIKCKDGLFAEDTVSINVLPLTKANAGRDTLYCPNEVNRLNANIVGSSESGIWSLVTSNNAGITIQTITNPNSPFTLNPNISGTTTLRWTITNSNGCTSYDDVVISNCGGVTPVFAGMDQVIGNCFSNTTCTNLSAKHGGIGIGGQLGIWSLVSGPNIPTFTILTSPTTKVCNLIQGTYVFRYTVSGPCANGFDDVQVIVPAPTQNITIANANVLSTTTNYCGLLNSIALNGNLPQFTGEVVRWTQVSGPIVQLMDSTTSSTTITGINEYGTYCFKYSIINNASSCYSDNVVCYTFNSNGTVEAGPNQILACNVTTAIIPTVVTGNGTLNYKIISGPSGAFTYPVNYRTSNIINNLTYPGTYRVEVNYSFGLGCSPINDFVDITVSRTPTRSNAGSDQNFACTSTATQLAGNNPSITGLGTGRWSQISGPNTSTLVTPTNYICNIRNTIPGVYVYRWTISGGNVCQDNFDDIRVVIPDTSVTVANAGADKVICPFSSLSLNGNSIRADETVQWTSIPGGLSFFPGNNIVSPTVSGLLINTVYSFIYTITNSCGSISKDTIVVTTSSAAGPSSADAGPNQCLPGGTSTIQLNAVAPNTGTGVWSKISGPNANITNNTLYNTSVTGLSNGTYQFIWKVTVNGCLNSTEDTVTITIAPNTTIANAGTDIITCADNIRMNANVPVSGSGNWVQISGDGDAIIASLTDPKTIISNLSSGVYIFRWTISNNACTSSSDDIKITISLPPSTSNAGPDQNLCGANATQTSLVANTPLVGTGQWVQVSGPSTALIANNTLPNTNISSLTNGIYTFRWIIAGGPNCPSSTDEVQIRVALPANAGQDQNLCNATSTTLSGNIGSNGVWSQVSGPSVNITQLSGNPNASISGLITGSSYTFRYTLPSIYGCPGSFDDINVNNGTFAFVPDAGSDVVLCNASSLALSASSPGIGETGLWSVLSGPTGATFTPSASNPVATLNGMVPGTYILKWTVSNSFCSSSDQKRIDNFATPSIANAGVDQKVCFEKAILRGNIPARGTGTWSQISGPVSTPIAAINNPVSEVSGLNAVGIYLYVWTISNGQLCIPSSDTIRLTVSSLSPSLANAGDDREICNLASIELNGNIPSTGTGLWSEIGTNSSAVISAPGSASTNVSSLNLGEHLFVWSISNADRSCYSRDTIKISNNVMPNTANAGIDDTFCVFNTIRLNANTPVDGTTGSWSILSGPNTPTFQNINQPNSLLTGIIPGTYRFRWSISNTSCPTSSDEVQVTIINNPNQALAGADQTLCTTTLNLYGNAPGGGNQGEWSQFSGPSAANIVSPLNSNSVVSNLLQGTYKFIWKIYNAGCFTTDTVTFNIKEPAEVFAGNDKLICTGTEAILLSEATFNSPENNKAVWTLISGYGILSNTAPTANPDTVKYIPANGESGNIIIRLSAQDACRVITDDMQISLNDSQVPVLANNDYVTTDISTPIYIYALENDTIVYTDTLNFCAENTVVTNPKNGTVIQSSDGSFLYTPSSYFSGLDSFQYRICTDELLDSSLSALCLIPGSDSAWIVVQVISKNCLIPNAFSPNGDGINDAFVIECGTEKQLSVFNQYGIELYRNDDYQNDWQGKYNDSPLPDGTYFYSLKYKSSTFEYIKHSGFICLHR